MGDAVVNLSEAELQQLYDEQPADVRDLTYLPDLFGDDVSDLQGGDGENFRGVDLPPRFEVECQVLPRAANPHKRPR